MRTKFLCAALLVIFAGQFANSQSGVEPTPTPVEVVVTNSMPAVKPAATRPRVTPTPIVVGAADRISGPAVATETTTPATSDSTTKNTAGAGRLISFGQIKSKIAEAKRQLQTRPLATGLVEGTAPTDYVRVEIGRAHV